MDIKTKRNDLLEREELTIASEPISNEALKEGIAKQLGKDKELIVIKHIYSQYGKKKVEALAYIYDNKEAMKVEPKKKEKKGEVKKEEKPAEEPQAEKKEEPKPEEKKEEKPAEEKKEVKE